MNKRYLLEGILFELEMDGVGIEFPLHNQLKVLEKLHGSDLWKEAITLERLWMSNQIEAIAEGFYILTYDQIYELSEEDKEVLDTARNTLEIYVSDIGNVGSSSYRVLWECHCYGKYVGRILRYENVVFVGREQFLLTKQQWKVIQIIGTGTEKKTLQEQFELQAQIMEQGAKGKIMYPSSWRLSVTERKYS